MRTSLLRHGTNPRNVNLHNLLVEKYPSHLYHWACFSLVTAVFGIGHYLEQVQLDRMSKFRDKSAMFGKDLGPDDPPSWGLNLGNWRFKE